MAASILSKILNPLIAPDPVASRGALPSASRVKLSLQPSEEAELTIEKRISVEEQSAILPRLRRVQAWRRKRLQRLLSDPNIAQNDPGRYRSIKAAQHYMAVSMRAKAILMGLIER